MTAQVDTAVGPWVDRDSSGHDGLDDVLLDQLAADLGGNPMPISTASQSCGPAGSHQFNAPLSQTGSLPLSGAAQLGRMPAGLMQQGSLPQPMVLPFGLHCDPQQLHNGTLPSNFGSAPDPPQPNSLNSANSLSFGPGSLMQPQAQPFLMFRPAFGANGVLPAVAAATPDMRPAASKSQSPSTSSGCHPSLDECLEQSDLHRANKTLNKGALAQKRFRERQKEKMRANEAQVAELTRKLGQLEVEKSRLESRARLLEQVVSLNLIHEAKLHTNREIMVREQEMLLEDLAAFILQLSAATHNTSGSGHNTTGSSSPDSPEWLHGALAGAASMMAQQQQQLDNQVLQQQDVLHLLQQQQQQPGVGAVDGLSSGSSSNSVRVHGLAQVIRGWTVQNMVDQVFPQYIRCLQRLLPFLNSAACNGSSGSSAFAATAAAQQVEALVLKRREMTDRHALFSHYYWAVWCFNRGDRATQQLMPPTPAHWARVLAHLNLSKEQTDAIVAARTGLLRELQRVASDWQRVLPTLALQLLQVPRAQWHTVGAVQAMVTNLAAEREAVVGFLHTIIDEVLTPIQEGQLEASSYPWCPDVWTIAGAAAATTAAAAAAAAQASQPDSSLRGKGGRKGSQGAQDMQQMAAAAVQVVEDEDPLAALAVGTDVLQPLMPFMTAFQLLREPVTAKGAGLRLKRALLLDPFRTVVPAAAYPQPTTLEVSAMSLLDAHCGTFQKVMLWDWLKTNLPSYVTILGMHTHLHTTVGPISSSAAAALVPPPLGLGLSGGVTSGSFTSPPGLPAAPTAVVGLQHSLSNGNLAGPGMFMV